MVSLKSASFVRTVNSMEQRLESFVKLWSKNSNSVDEPPLHK
jgi:hypothetical protein